MSIHDGELLEWATNLARKSPNLKWKLGAVLHASDGQLFHGTNSISYGVDDPPFSEHAEEAVLDGVSRELTIGATLYVARVKRSGTVGLARPCGNCADLIRWAGIERVVWTGVHGELCEGTFS